MNPSSSSSRPFLVAGTLFRTFFLLAACSVSMAQSPELQRLPAPEAGNSAIGLQAVANLPPAGQSIALTSYQSIEDCKPSTHRFRVGEVLESIEEPVRLVAMDEQQLRRPWWTPHVVESFTSAGRTSSNVDDLIQMAVASSAQLKVFRRVPVIRQTELQEADATFDWTATMNSVWDDVSQPISSALTAGGSANRLDDHSLGMNGGIGRRLSNGGSFGVRQYVGLQDSNSAFFLPNEQGTTRMSLNFTQPLLRGSGRVYNRGLIVLANIAVQASRDDYMRQLQGHLLEVARGYWQLYQERARLAQQVNLYLRTDEVYRQLATGQQDSVPRTQLVSAKAAVEARKSALIRVRSAVKNAEARLRVLTNAPELGSATEREIIPTDVPLIRQMHVQLDQELQTAIANRPEIRKQVKEIRSATIRLNLSKNEVLPLLDVTTRLGLNGLNDEFAVGSSFLDQFVDGTPTYGVGVNFELPLGRRAANARRDRRQQELRQLQSQYQATVETVAAEVDVAVREVETSYREMLAKHLAMKAAAEEESRLQSRWVNLASREGTGSLALEALLRAQERLTDAEFEFLQSQLAYNLSLVSLRRANGTLMQWSPVDGSGGPVMTPPAAPQPETEWADEAPPANPGNRFADAASAMTGRRTANGMPPQGTFSSPSRLLQD